MTEKLLHFIWQFQYYNRLHLVSTNQEEIQILHPGQLNTNQGPDFLNARIKIGTTILVGSIELHLQTSDWTKHGHHTDRNYNNVILHVVYKHDSLSPNNLPILELESRISKLLLRKYESLMNDRQFISCSSTISSVRDITIMAWKDRLLAERLTRKSKNILNNLQETNKHWEESFWWALARNFGGKINGDAFEAIARSLPITTLAKHKNQIHQLEALLIGQSGLLEGAFEEEYPLLLQREYQFLKAKYQLPPILQPIHFLRMRPGNFPTIRLAQLAMLIHQSNHLFSQIVEADSCSAIKNLIRVTANDYWHYHYRFEEETSYLPKRLGDDMLDNLIINTIAPSLFAYGLYHKEDKYKSKAIQWLEETKAEENSIVKEFKKLTLAPKSAFDSQALIEMKNEYCSLKRCLECTIGIQLFKQAD